VHTQLDDHVTAILTRLRRSRLLGSDETGARVNGRTQWAWVFQHPAVCVHVMRPSRGHGVLRDILGDHRPTI
jgi:transposase